MIIFDTETTGLQPGSRIIELGSVRVDDAGKVIDTFHRMINPQMPLPADALAVNRITKEMLDAAAMPGDAFADWLNWVGDEAFGAAHYAPYDVGVLSWGLGRAGLVMPSFHVIDTCEMAKAIKQTKNNKLQTLVEHYKIKVEGEAMAHRAIADCHACRIYYSLAKDKTEVRSRIWTAPYVYVSPSLLPIDLELLPEAVAKGLPFSFRYQDAQGNITNRTITPYGWAMVNGNIIFHGMDHMRNERREFRADRVLV